MRALLIEDEETLARSIQRWLRSDCELEYACTGQDGLQAVRDRRYDVVFVDLGLPDTDGMEVCARLRFLAPRVPVYVVTGLRDEDLDEASRYGVRDVILKSPHLVADLRAVLGTTVHPRTA